MALKQEIQEDLKNAIRKKEETELLVLRTILASLHNREIEKKSKLRKSGVSEEKMTEEEISKKGQITDEELIEVIFSEVKKRKEAILEFEKGKREDLVKKEKREMEILQKYMPEQLSEGDIKKLVKEAIEKTGAIEIKDIGKVMGQLMPKVKGKADGSVVSKVVKELLTSQTNE